MPNEMRSGIKAASRLFGNRRDSLARSLIAALQRTTTSAAWISLDGFGTPGRLAVWGLFCAQRLWKAQAPRTAAVILFEGGRRFKDLTWWILGPEFLTDITASQLH